MLLSILTQGGFGGKALLAIFASKWLLASMYTLVVFKCHGVIELLSAERAARNPVCRVFSAHVLKS